MIDRMPNTRDIAVDERTASLNAERLSTDGTFRNERTDALSSWNSWGERNSFSLGSYGRW